MAGPSGFFFALLALCALARGAAPTFPTACPGPSGHRGTHSSLPGFVAHAESPGDGDGGGNPPPYAPVVTPPPDQDARLAGQGYRQDTYYTCRTVAGSAHCGWHVPLVRVPEADGGASALQSLGGAAAGTGAVAAAVACLAGVFALGLM